MKNNVLYFLLLFFLSLSQLGAQTEVNYFGDIPANRLSATKWQNFEWDSSGNWETIDVTQEGIVPDATTDIVPKVMSIIANGSGKRILKFPAGTFHIKSRLKILKGDIQIVGEGKATKFILQGGSNPGYITAFGGESGNYKLAADASRGDSQVTLTSTSGLNVGDYFIVKQNGQFRVPDHDPVIVGNETQIFKITAKNGNTLSLDMKFGISFFKKEAWVQKMSFLKNIRFHNFYIERPSTTSGDGDVNIYLRMLQNAEFSNVESKNALKTHVALFNSRDVIFFQNYMHGNFGCDKCGGYQYGISLVSCTKVNLINNRGSDLRHFFVSQFGTNHCVFAYNRAEAPHNQYGDIGQHNSKGCHNNLFEGNYGEEIFDDGNLKSGWGTRYTMWFRNHAITQIGSTSRFVEHMTMIGNEIESEDGERTGIRDGEVGVPGKYTFSGANILNVSAEGEGGHIIWGDMEEGAAIPASLFLTNKPSYLSKWPLYGPPASEPIKYQLDFVNLKNNDEINKGSDLVVEALVADEFAEVSLYINDTLLSTLTEAPYQWSTFPQLMDMMAPVYSLKLVGELQDGEQRETAITVTTPEQWANTSDLLPHPIPGVIQAEAYDNGGENIAYFDKTEQQSPNFSYRGNDKVDLSNDGLWLNLVDGGEWLEYTIDVQRSGNYALAVKHQTRR